jgi:alkanesulfonate monooxygenase SsuD/methylene tetrahydromethanopterin reductase-like flavin-dependent oxidoreductase (luciferase family)
MNFAYFSHVWTKRGMTPAQRYDELWREVRLADELGFDSVMSVEHHFTPQESLMPSPAIFCMGAAAHSANIRIGSMGYVAALYDPLRIVEETAAIDQATGGRLELGFASGVAPHFFSPYGANFDARRSAALEALELVRAAGGAGEGPLSFAGPDHSYDDVVLSVPYLQNPHPPLWLPSRDRRTLRRLAAMQVSTGSVFFVPRSLLRAVYSQYLREASRAGSWKPNIGYWTLVYVGETDEDALNEIREALHDTLVTTLGLGDAADGRIPALTTSYGAGGGPSEEVQRATDVDFLLERNLLFVGSAETVVRRIEAAAREGLFNTVLAEMNFGQMPFDMVEGSAKRFATQVIPRLRDRAPF